METRTAGPASSLAAASGSSRRAAPRSQLTTSRAAGRVRGRLRCRGPCKGFPSAPGAHAAAALPSRHAGRHLLGPAGPARPGGWRGKDRPAAGCCQQRRRLHRGPGAAAAAGRLPRQPARGGRRRIAARGARCLRGKSPTPAAAACKRALPSCPMPGALPAPMPGCGVPRAAATARAPPAASRRLRGRGRAGPTAGSPRPCGSPWQVGLIASLKNDHQHNIVEQVRPPGGGRQLAAAAAGRAAPAVGLPWLHARAHARRAAVHRAARALALMARAAAHRRCRR